MRPGQPPNGLQLTLRPSYSYQRYLQSSEAAADSATGNQSASLSATFADQSDTLVMQNLGYFQLQANPGLYVLNLAEVK